MTKLTIVSIKTNPDQFYQDFPLYAYIIFAIIVAVFAIHVSLRDFFGLDITKIFTGRRIFNVK